MANLFSFAFSQTTKNAGFLKGSYLKNGYDWWWHSFVAVNRETGEIQSFFIEYYFINPKLAKDSVVFGQVPGKPQKPGYAMLKCGTWKENGAVQLHNFYSMSQASFDTKKLNVKIGQAVLTETSLSGKVHVDSIEAGLHPEWMSDGGSMQWNLTATKVLSYDAGYGTGRFFRALKAFKMYWHVQGMLTQFKGEIIYNGEVFDVFPETSFGYQDKNWGRDYTNPWIWLNCNNWRDKQGNALTRTSLDVGGGRPVVFGIPFNEKVLVAFYDEGKLIEFNFSKIGKKAKTNLDCSKDEKNVFWKITATNRHYKLLIDFHCPRNTMLKVNYENPKGERNHTELWNGGYAQGSLTLFEKVGGKWQEKKTIYGSLGGCEFGKYTN